MTPNPGSAAALAQGCKCAVLDNHYGAGSGYRDDESKPTFWVTQGCPVHVPTPDAP